jgi:glycogen debranching enzyme
MWTQIGTYNYILYTNDTAFLTANWAKYQFAMRAILAKVDSTGLLNVTGTRDWARSSTGNHSTEANMILYHNLMTGASLATWMGNASLAANWTTRATQLQNAINTAFWLPEGGAYKDNDTSTTLMPQDANRYVVSKTLPRSFNLIADTTPVSPFFSQSHPPPASPLSLMSLSTTGRPSVPPRPSSSSQFHPSSPPSSCSAVSPSAIQRAPSS